MAPPKTSKIGVVSLNTRSTRSQNKSIDQISETKANGKRKAEENEDKPSKRSRAVLGNITNAVIVNETEVRKNGLRNDQMVLGITNLSDPKKKELQKNALYNPTDALKSNKPNLYGKPPMVPLRAPKVMTRAAARAKAVQETVVLKPVAPNDKVAPARRISNEFDKMEDTLYLSAHEDLSSDRYSLNSTKRLSLMSNVDSSSNTTLFTTVIDQDDVISESVPPPGIIDFDKQSPNDPYEVSEYTMDIFNYLKEREKFYPMQPYMDKQPHITKWMRMLVVDWMVEVQETFELNHETLYLAVKVLDSYLGQKVILKDNLQLLGAAALFIACKFDVSIYEFMAFLFIQLKTK